MRSLLVCALCALLLACDRGSPDAVATNPAPLELTAAVQPLFEGLGGLHFPITTRSEAAQQYFDQGLMLAFAFNHAAADLAFQEAARQDPDCALCYWGSALVLGPNINSPMDPAVVPRAHGLAQRAQGLAVGATEKERLLAAALAQRYPAAPIGDRRALDEAYAQAMREVAARFPDDVDIAALTAEALMDLHPWDLWLASGEARPWTQEIVALLESALRREPEHVGAMHLYIHSVEASQHAERAEAYADRLAALAPHAGHLVHMPAHIYIRIGRYHDATLTNIAAAAADTRFLAACHANGLAYRLGYVPHNYHFGWVTAAMEGWSAKAAELARATSERIPVEMMREAGLGTLQQYFVTPLFDGVRFGRWDEILAYAAPAEDLVYARAIWQYAQGRAHAARGQMEAAQGDLETLVQIAADPRLAGITIWDINRATDLVAIAAEVLTGELAAARGEFPTAVTHLRRAVELEDALKYNEPPDWFYPVRHSLGAVLLAAGDAEGAREVYEQDLRIYRDNGWSLYGLAQALRALGQDAAAQAVEPRLRVAWQHADFELTGSRL